MKITSIKQQVKRSDRYSIFIDGKYSFSLSEKSLLEAGIVGGQEIGPVQVERYKQLSADDKIYGRALRYVAMRPRTIWELQTYLQRKDSPAPLTEQITNKLIDLGLLDDATFAVGFVRDRQLLRPTSRRKLIVELKKKHISQENIEKAMEANDVNEANSLQEVVDKKRRQSKYQDDVKLMQYLARQGFSYGDIKAVLHHEDDA